MINGRLCWRKNGWVFIYELTGCEFESSCSYLNFRFHACFEQGVPSDNYSVDLLWNAYVTWQEHTVKKLDLPFITNLDILTSLSNSHGFIGLFIGCFYHVLYIIIIYCWGSLIYPGLNCNKKPSTRRYNNG